VSSTNRIRIDPVSDSCHYDDRAATNHLSCGMAFNLDLAPALFSQMICSELKLLNPSHVVCIVSYFAIFVTLLCTLSNVHCVPCLLCNTEVLFYIAGSGRERSDSVPSRTRTISDGSHPLAHPHSSRSLVPNSGNSRPHSVCWPAGSPVR
jgi:hypothetical protein